MEQEFYLELITRYLDNSATEQEAELLLGWLKSKKENMDIFVQTRDLWTKSSLLSQNNSDTEMAMLRFKNRVSQKGSKESIPTNVFQRYGNIAAIIVIVILSGILTYKTLDQSDQPSKKVTYNETVVPKGQKSKVILSDGTKIYLNSGSRLKYPSNFNQKNREVYLQGEAYFDVAHDKSKPFLVHSGKMTVKVLGTSFNVKSYPEENKIETTLVTGSIEIIEIKENKTNRISTLKPNEQAIYDKTNGDVFVKKLEDDEDNASETPLKEITSKALAVQKISPRVESIILWKDQKLIFENETMEQMAQKLTRWFGKNVHIESERLKSNRYSGKFIYNETIYQVLEILSLTTDIKYYEKDHEIYIMSKN